MNQFKIFPIIKKFQYFSPANFSILSIENIQIGTPRILNRMLTKAMMNWIIVYIAYQILKVIII